MKTIDQDIKEGKLKNVYLLYGVERYLIRQYRDKLKRAIVIEDDTMNFSSFSGADVNQKEIIDLAETLPFFAERRLILIEDSGLFKKGAEELADYMAHIPENTYFLFVEKEVDRKTMQSRLVPGLYILGEALDIDGISGGYNLQACMSEAYLAVKDILGL